MKTSAPLIAVLVLVALAPLVLPRAALAQPPPPQPNVEIDPPPLPVPPLPPRQAPREEPPTPAHPHTELESGPPTADQSDPWPAVPKRKDAALSYPMIVPYASIVGGGAASIPIQYDATPATKTASAIPGSAYADTVSTIMISDFGVRGALLPWISFESELMANGGLSLTGSSAFEGQASLQVRKQVIHLGKDGWTLEVGRVVDEASVDYFSAHVADCFLMDPATEPFLLFDGFNLGNGVRGTAEIVKGLRIGMEANAGNPTSNSAIFAFGGGLPPSGTVFGQAAATVQSNASNYPTDQFQAYVLSPSAMYKNKYFEAKSELQYFFVNPNTDGGGAKTLRGYNVRANAVAHIADDLVMPFVNFNYGENDTVGSNVDIISPNRYVAIGIGGGVDVNYQKKFGNYNGFGVMFAQDESQVGPTGIITRSRYYNIGTTYWLAPMLAAGLRYGEYTNEELNQPTAGAQQPSSGSRMVLLTLRLVL
jgi:hypothetical protein